MSSRRRREPESSSRREAYKIWQPTESDSDHRPRQTMTTSQRPNVDQGNAASGTEKPHRSRRAEPSGDVPTSSAYAHHRAGSKEQANPAAPSSSFYTVAQAQAQLLQNTVPPLDTTQPASGSSRPRTKDPSKDSYSIRSLMKRKTEKRSSPSSDEKVFAAEQARSTRSGKQPREGYQPTDAAPLAPASTQTYWIPPESTPKEPSSSRQRDREKEIERERRHAEKARLKEEDRARRKAEEKAKLREEERVRERAYEAERERRREKEAARERRRQEKEREREQSTKPRDRDKTRETESRRRDDPRYPEYLPSQPQAAASQPKWASGEDRISVSEMDILIRVPQ